MPAGVNSDDCPWFGKIVYVNAKNTSPFQDGKSWRTAFSTLQPGLDLADQHPGVAIWVAEGVYIPTMLYTPLDANGNPVPGGAAGITTPEMNTFNVPDNTSIYGGFRGYETKQCQRNWKKYPAVCSGCCVSWHTFVMGNDVTQVGVRAILDGLTIIDGNAAGPSDGTTLEGPFIYQHSDGGGIYAVFDSSYNLNNCLVDGNRAANTGGGVFSSNCNFNIYRTDFKANSSQNTAGGLAVFNTYEKIPHTGVVTGSKFTGNNTVLFGGGACVEGTFASTSTSTVFVSCDFDGNRAFEGGGLIVDSEAVTTKGCTFTNNIGYTSGGGIATTNFVNTIAATIKGVDPVLFTTIVTDCCVFSNNLCTVNAGAHDTMFGGPAVSNTNFPLGGGAGCCYIGGLLLVNGSRFENNVSFGDAGALLNGNAAAQDALGFGVTAYDASITVNNCEFIGNKAKGNGGAIASEPNTFVFPGQPPLIIPVGATSINVTASTFENNSAQGIGGAIYIVRSSGSLIDNKYKGNRAPIAPNVYISPDSVISVVDTCGC